MLKTDKTGYGVHGNFLVSSQFFCKSKTILKIKSIILKKKKKWKVTE